MTEATEGKTVTVDLDAGTETVTAASPKPRKVLNPVTLKVIERAIQEVLGEYVKTTKQFTADSLHGIRVKVTELVKQRLGEDEIQTVDLGLDLAKVGEIPFFFKVNVAPEKHANHFMDAPEVVTPLAPVAPAPVEAPAQDLNKYSEALSVEDFKKIVEADGR
jgi:hypothetical protein